MNQPIIEQLSALADGELERDQTRFLLKRIANEGELVQRWERYHVVRHTLRRQELPALRPGFAEVVMLRLDDESTVRVSSGLPVWLRWGAGGAIAASVAIAALVVSQPIHDAAPDGAMMAGAGTVAPGIPANALPASANSAHADFRAPMMPLTRPVETAPASFGSDASSTVMEPRIHSYLIRHYQAAGAAGQPAFVPYVLLGTAQPEQPSSQGDEAASHNH